MLLLPMVMFKIYEGWQSPTTQFSTPSGRRMARDSRNRDKKHTNYCSFQATNQPSQGSITSTETLCMLSHTRKGPKIREAKARNRGAVTSSQRRIQSFAGLATSTDTFCMLLHGEEMPKTRRVKAGYRAIVAQSNKF